MALNRAALYMRLSRDDENAGESVSIGTQRMILNAYAQEHSFTVQDEYVDVYNQRLIPFDTKMAVKMIK